MRRKIQYAETFDITLKALVLFIEENWSADTVKRFIKNTEKVIENIMVHPYIFKSTHFDKEVRVAQVNKLSLLYYHVSKTHITLLYIVDSRQESYWM